jgi:hypothetical protein
MKDLRHLVKITIQEILNNTNKSITLYHKVGGKQTPNMEERVKNVVINGLKPYDSIGGEFSERGSIIWFSSDYIQYGKEGDFVLSIEYNKENAKKFDMRFDGQYCSVSKEIPFNELKIIRIPIVLMNDNKVSTNDFLINIINKGFTPEKLSNLVNENKYKIFVDLFEEYVQPNINDSLFTSKLKKLINPKSLITIN